MKSNNYIHGIQNGICIHWHENGRKKIDCFFKNGEINGKFTEWDSSGEIIQEYKYNRGVVT